MLFWNVLCSFVTHINELAVMQRCPKYKIKKDNQYINSFNIK